MQHPNTGQIATPRLRPSRATTNPASKGAGGLRHTPAQMQADLQTERRKLVRSVDAVLAALDRLNVA
jgi:hypothetical protein